MNAHHIEPVTSPVAPWRYRFADDGTGVDHPAIADEGFADDGTGVDHPAIADDGTGVDHPAIADDGTGVDHPAIAAEDIEESK